MSAKLENYVCNEVLVRAVFTITQDGFFYVAHPYMLLTLVRRLQPIPKNLKTQANSMNVLLEYSNSIGCYQIYKWDTP